MADEWVNVKLVRTGVPLKTKKRELLDRLTSARMSQSERSAQ